MVGILLVTHAPLGQAFLDTLSHVHKHMPDRVLAIDVLADQDVDSVQHSIERALNEVDAGHGVLLLTDVCGATPANCAVRALNTRTHCQLVYGLSLPALLRGVNYRHKPLNELVVKVIEGGQAGVFAHAHTEDSACPPCAPCLSSAATPCEPS